MQSVSLSALALVISITILVPGTAACAEELPTGLPAIESVRTHYALYDVEGYQLSDGSIRIGITRRDGNLLFESRYPVEGKHGKLLVWRYDDGQTNYSRSTVIPESEPVSVQQMLAAGKSIVRMVARGQRPPDTDGTAPTYSSMPPLRPEPLDNKGCDWPFEDLSCTAAGNCCDTHDACYAAFGCSALSWLGLESVYCTACNLTLTACVASGEGSNNLPSVCCFYGNCGDPQDPLSGGGGGGGHDPLDIDPDPSGSGGGGSWYDTPYGSVFVGPGTCTFPNGVTVPCG